MNSGYSRARPAMKRKRSYSSNLDEDDFGEGNSKAWDDPTILEEMGLGILGSDVSSSDEEGLEGIIGCTSSDSDENVSKKQERYCQVPKKRRIGSLIREPFKEQLIENKANIQNSQDEEAKIEKLKPANCGIKNTQAVSYEKDENANRGGTDLVCNNEFIISRIKIEDKTAGKDYFEMLPDELILTIMKNLDRRSVVNLCVVSKRMNRIAGDESFWTRADLSGRNLPKLSLGYLMRRGPLILRLASASLPDPICEPRQFPETFLCKTQYLDLSMAIITQKGLATFLSYCTKLKKLSVENCPLGNNVAACIAQNKGLEVLNMTMCSDVTTEVLKKILMNCTRLQSLNIGWTSLSQVGVKAICAKLPANLERICISGCRKNITDDDVIGILERCKNLLELDISDGTDLTERVIDYIAKNVSGLEYLAISRCYNIPHSCIRKLNRVDSLVYLDAFGMFSEPELNQLRLTLEKIQLNMFTFSSVARPTVGLRRTSIWGLPTRD